MGNRPLLVPMLIAGILALVGIAQMPYGYYEFLRWALTAASITLAIVSWKLNRKNWLIVAIPIFILWFPPFQIFMDKSVWVFLDLFAGSALISAGFLLTPGNREINNSKKEVQR